MMLLSVLSWSKVESRPKLTKGGGGCWGLGKRDRLRRLRVAPSPPKEHVSSRQEGGSVEAVEVEEKGVF